MTIFDLGIGGLIITATITAFVYAGLAAFILCPIWAILNDCEA